jgi:hypothetical protein
MVFAWVVPLVAWLAATAPEAVGVVEKHTKQLNEERQFVVTVANLSQKSIVGYVLNAELLNAEGRLLESVTLAGVSYDANVERKRPGEKWEVTVDARTSKPPQEVAADVNIKVDTMCCSPMARPAVRIRAAADISCGRSMQGLRARDRACGRF